MADDKAVFVSTLLSGILIDFGRIIVGEIRIASSV